MMQQQNRQNYLSDTSEIGSNQLKNKKQNSQKQKVREYNNKIGINIQIESFEQRACHWKLKHQQTRNQHIVLKSVIGLNQ